MNKKVPEVITADNAKEIFETICIKLKNELDYHKKCKFNHIKIKEKIIKLAKEK